MGNIIIIAVLAVIVYNAVKFTVEHIKGTGGGCCSGGESDAEVIIPHKELSGKKIGEKHVSIEGMQCNNCVKSVTEAINKLSGASAKVSLENNEAVVSYDREISDKDIKKAIENAGYKVISIS